MCWFWENFTIFSLVGTWMMESTKIWGRNKNRATITEIRKCYFQATLVMKFLKTRNTCCFFCDVGVALSIKHWYFHAACRAVAKPS